MQTGLTVSERTDLKIFSPSELKPRSLNDLDLKN